MRSKLFVAVIFTAVIFFGLSSNVGAEQITFKAVSAFTEGTFFSKIFERFINKVNSEGKGLVQIKYLGGGAKVMSPFEVGNAVRKGVVDMVNTTGAFYTNLVPEASALKLAQLPIQELRKNGGWELINKIHNEKLNAYFLAKTGDGVPFHLYLNKKISTPDLSGLKIRVTPIYRAFFMALNGVATRTAPGEVYTALERGVVDGYGWPIQGIFDLGWQEVTKYRVDPGFYDVDVSVLINLNKWKNMTDEQRDFLIVMATWLESLNKDNFTISQTEAKRQADAGIEAITFSPDENKNYLEKAYEAGWNDVIKTCPQYGPQLKKLFGE